MIQLILGNKGKGKTKVLLDKANTEIKVAHGSIVYLDKSAKHMYELNNKVRLIDISGFDLKSSEEFIGFIYGIISQDHDLEQMYLDSFLTIAKAETPDEANAILKTLLEIGQKYDVSFIISISLQADDIDAGFKENIIAEL
ncbi:MAG: cytochrome P450 [Lachnospiraceae bacterium]|nr:cytochrome P450 [Lachnospiraceae bacterium]